MPELPEVQTIVTDLINAELIGKEITGVEVFWNQSIGTLTPHDFIHAITGQVVTKIWRRAKYIVIDFQNGFHLLTHLRMSGRLQIVPTLTERKKHEHVIIHFKDNRDLRFHDTRKFGRMTLTDNPDAILNKLGPEPLSDDFTVDRCKSMLKSRSRQLKPLLLDQSFIAGMGNIYVDEALWEARLHPLRIASSLSFRKVQDLHKSIRLVLQQGIDNQGTSLGNGKSNFAFAESRRGKNVKNLEVFQRTGMNCSRCGVKIKRIIVGQRSTHICPKCQKPL